MLIAAHHHLKHVDIFVYLFTRAVINVPFSVLYWNAFNIVTFPHRSSVRSCLPQTIKLTSLL